jgi:L-ascorbate metabolism protein UlaG (beta-lactamase superfamily)
MRIGTNIAIGCAAFALAATAAAQNVKVTFLGTHAGELCSRDRATVFEDPSGLRILYDAGQSVLGGDDPRLGTIHVVLVSHAHGDHIGDSKLKAQGAGTCDAPEVVSAAPNSTSGEIAAAKNAALVMVGPMANFLGKKVEAIKGKPTANCAQANDVMTAPFAAPCVAGVNLGGARIVKLGDGKTVEITVVPASHDSTVPRALLSEEERKHMDADNVSLQLGQPTGYVIRFSNGLTAYLTGDTGMFAEMKTTMNEFHHVNLIELNLGYSALNAQAAAYIVNDMVKPVSVILSHVNEGATSGGKAKPGTHTADVMALVKNRPVYLGLSGKTMEFDGTGKCVTGC